MAIEKKRYSTLHLVLDMVLIFATGGLWFLWILVRFLRSV